MVNWQSTVFDFDWKTLFPPKKLQRSSGLIVRSCKKDINKDNETYSFFKWQLYKLTGFFLDYELAGVCDKIVWLQNGCLLNKTH